MAVKSRSEKPSVACSICGKKIPPGKLGTGYGVMKIDGREKKVCYKCIGKLDRREMDSKKPGERMILYLFGDIGGKMFVGNWPGSMKIPVSAKSTGRHNIAGKRIDVWFKDGKKRWWHGVQMGDYNDLCHCRLLKHPPDFAR